MIVDRLGDQVMDVELFRNVRLDKLHRADGGEIAFGRLTRLDVDIGDDDPGALAGETARDGEADALGTPGDDCGFSIEAHANVLSVRRSLFDCAHSAADGPEGQSLFWAPVRRPVICGP